MEQFRTRLFDPAQFFRRPFTVSFVRVPQYRHSPESTINQRLRIAIVSLSRYSELEEMRSVAPGNLRTENDEVMSRLRECLCGRPEVVVAYLFGSVARGDDRADSDVDIAVLIDTDQYAQGDDPYGYRVSILGDLLACLKRNDVDLVLLNNAPIVLSHRVLRDGRLILCRDENRRVQLTERVIRDYCDTAHLRELRAQYLERSILNGTYGKVVPYRTVVG